MVRTPVSQLAKLAQYQKQWLQHHGSQRPALGGTEQLHSHWVTPTFLQLKWEPGGQILHTKQGIIIFKWKKRKKDLNIA